MSTTKDETEIDPLSPCPNGCGEIVAYCDCLPPVDTASAVRDAAHLIEGREVSAEEERQMQAMEDDCESDA